MVVFECEVVGTGPQFADEYEVEVELLNQSNQIVDIHKSGKRNCEKDGKPTQIKVCLKPNEITKKIRVTLSGKDVEYWGGHFGTRFRNESITLTE